MQWTQATNGYARLDNLINLRKLDHYAINGELGLYFLSVSQARIALVSLCTLVPKTFPLIRSVVTKSSFQALFFLSLLSVYLSDYLSGSLSGSLFLY